VTNALYNTAREGLLTGAIDLDTAVIKCSLVRGYTFSSAHTFVSDVTGASGTINGTSTALANKSTTSGVFDADDTTITTTASAIDHGLLIFQSSAVTGGADVATSAQRVIAYYDTGTGLAVQPGTGTTTVTWASSADKIFRLS
jgi:hypothetical protein